MDKEMMSKMLAAKKSGGGMSDMEKDAKMGVVQAMKDMASKAMGEKLRGLKKVSVASDSPEGLSAGLDKAKELLNAHVESEDNDAMGEIEGAGHDLHSMGEESPEHEASESPEEEASEHGSEFDSLSEDEIDQKLQELMKMKEMKKAAR